jgi:SAM-dependent methyltransferase
MTWRWGNAAHRAALGCQYGAVDRLDTRDLWNANAPAWTELSRAGFDVYRDLVNTPAFFAMLPPIDGLRCLDLGCGEGHNTRLLADRGAEVVALDIATAFIDAAAKEAQRGIRYVVGDGSILPFAVGSFDVVTAFMSLMDVGDPERTLSEMARVLRPGGFAQFSVVHPTTSTPIRHWVDDESGMRHALAIGDYFYEGPVTETWTFGAAPAKVRDRHRPFTITYARRTLSSWLNAVLDAGLSIDAIDEPHADGETATEHPEVADTQIAPYFLLVRARKPRRQTRGG